MLRLVTTTTRTSTAKRTLRTRRTSISSFEQGLSGFPLVSRVLPQFLHHTLNQLLRVAQAFHHHLNVHHRLPRPTLTLAIHAVLAYQRHRIRDQIHRHRQTPAGNAHHGLVVLEFFLLVVEYRHRVDCSLGAG